MRSVGSTRHHRGYDRSNLGHSNPALTLRIYAHLMPSSQERTRKAIATVYDKARHAG